MDCKDAIFVVCEHGAEILLAIHKEEEIRDQQTSEAYEHVSHCQLNACRYFHDHFFAKAFIKTFYK